MGSTTPPWRVLDEPADAGDPTGRTSRGTAQTSPTTVGIDGQTLRVIALVGGALIAGVAALLVALSSGTGGELVVAGASGLPDSSAGSSVAEGTGTSPPASSVAGTLVVEIVGAVAHPGVYHLGPGARVGDLVAAGGGYSARVDTAQAERRLNLAQPLRDGDQVRVPSRDDPVDAPAASAGSATVGGAAADAPAGPIDLNTATAEQLDTLPGIGPVTAAKILAARDEAPFATVDDLRTRGLVGEKTFKKLRDAVTVR